MKTINFVLRGRTALLMHADDVEASDLLMAYRKAPANRSSGVAGDDRSPPWSWMSYVYSDGEHITIPSHNLMVALRSAGARVIMRGQKTFKEASQSGLSMTTEFLRFEAAGKQLPVAKVEALRDLDFTAQADAVRKMGFRLFCKRASVGTKKHVRVRPRFDAWSLSGSVDVLLPELTDTVVGQLFDLAGRVGLGDWRPGCKTPGPFGQFEATLQ